MRPQQSAARQSAALLIRLLQPRGALLLALIFNLPFVLFRLQRQSYDAYTHIFFADHYRHDWWTLWEPRWYLGFSVASYPPLVHQLMALLSWPFSAVIAAFAPEPELYPGAFRWLGLEAAYVVVLLAVVCLFPLAVREFARLFVGPRAASWAMLLAVFLPALHLAGWAFGQLPTLAATTALLIALARGAAFVRSGNAPTLLQAVALAALAAATHHAVFLFAPFGALAVIRGRGTGDGGRGSHVTSHAPPSTLHAPPSTLHPPPSTLRLLLWAALSALAVAAVLWPFLEWSRGQSLQTPIDHASRYNFLTQPRATLIFFWPVYGPLLALMPFALWLARRVRRLWALTAAWLLLFTLSLGGTTPLPRWLFGTGWEWLTYDRFGLWASVALLPVAGAVLVMATRRFGRNAAFVFAGALAVAGLVSGFHSLLIRAQPPALDLTPLVRFLDEPAQQPYRYLTLGFGDQLAKLATVTGNGTPDGTYHTARPLPELRTSGLGALDGALWNPQGVWAVAPFLREPQRYGVRWVFSNHPAYEPVLRATGWTYRFDVGAVKAWERADVRPLPATAPPKNVWAATWWGSAPLVTLALAALALAWPHRSRNRTDAALQTASVYLNTLRRALLTVTITLLSLWWVHVARGGVGDLPHIYFSYQSVLVFASDVALALTLAVWALERALNGRGERLTLGPRPALWAGLAVIAASALSLWHSVDVGLTLAFVTHLCLLAGLYLLWLNHPPGVRRLGVLFGVVVVVQGAVALAQVLAQSSVIPRELGLMWPGAFTAQTPGASVVLNAADARWLRAYGTLSHPNLLGALMLVYLGAVVERWLTTGKRRWLLLLGLGGVTLALTFSRAAWLGALALALAAWFLVPRAARDRLRVALALSAGLGLIAVLPLLSFLLGRLNLTQPANRLETASTLERTLLAGYALQAWQAAPLTGVGAGGFVQWAARYTGEAYPFQPVHTVPLLILAETGALGGAAALALFGIVMARAWRMRRALTVAGAVWSAVLVAILVAGLFDHLWWTQPPARVLAVIALAQWMSETP